jgi:cold shock CspA family protein
VQTAAGKVKFLNSERVWTTASPTCFRAVTAVQDARMDTLVVDQRVSFNVDTNGRTETNNVRVP